MHVSIAQPAIEMMHLKYFMFPRQPEPAMQRPNTPQWWSKSVTQRWQVAQWWHMLDPGKRDPMLPPSGLQTRQRTQ